VDLRLGGHCGRISAVTNCGSDLGEIKDTLRAGRAAAEAALPGDGWSKKVAAGGSGVLDNVLTVYCAGL